MQAGWYGTKQKCPSRFDSGARLLQTSSTSLFAQRRCNLKLTIAALYVLRDGPYFDLPDVDPWDQTRDARLYGGPWPVVAHPPCERWGRYWYGGPSARVRRVKGEDDGCFAAALQAVRRFGGVLEHPAASAAWATFGLNRPPRVGGWVNADFADGWTCCVDQKHFGHRAQKATWLYTHGVPLDKLPLLTWDKSEGGIRLDDGYHSAEERRRAIRTGTCQRLSHRQRAETPERFRDLLIGIAESINSQQPTL
jgi:hypothetical protein